MFHKYRDILYHGTIYDIKKIDVSFGRNYKDFGKGFYLAVSKQQAVGMMHKKYNESVRRNRNRTSIKFSEHLYEVKIDVDFLSEINVKVFAHADEEWLDFILKCREEGGVPHGYDVVIGPTADDNTILCLKTYWEGVYGKVGSYDAKRVLLMNLEPENLGEQYYISKQDVADRLIVSIKEIQN